MQVRPPCQTNAVFIMFFKNLLWRISSCLYYIQNIITTSCKVGGGEQPDSVEKLGIVAPSWWGRVNGGTRKVGRISQWKGGQQGKIFISANFCFLLFTWYEEGNNLKYIHIWLAFFCLMKKKTLECRLSVCNITPYTGCIEPGVNWDMLLRQGLSEHGLVGFCSVDLAW